MTPQDGVAVWKAGDRIDAPCGHARPQADNQIHGVCIFCWRDRCGLLNATRRTSPSAEDVRERAALMKRGADMLSAVAGDIEDGYSLDSLRGKYVMALIGVRDDMRAAIRALPLDGGA